VARLKLSKSALRASSTSAVASASGAAAFDAQLTALGKRDDPGLERPGAGDQAPDFRRQLGGLEPRDPGGIGFDLPARGLGRFGAAPGLGELGLKRLRAFSPEVARRRTQVGGDNRHAHPFDLANPTVVSPMDD